MDVRTKGSPNRDSPDKWRLELTLELGWMHCVD